MSDIIPKKIILFLLILVTSLTIFLSNLTVPSDNDLGWHLRYGKDVLTDGVIWRNNTYSTELAGYKWIHTSWYLDIFRYSLYEIGGLTAFTLMGGLTVVVTFLIIAKSFNISPWKSIFLLPLLSFAEYPLNVHSFRGEQVSLLFTAFLIYILTRIDRGKYKLAWVLPPFFALWININGQGILGVALLGVYVMVKIFLIIFKFYTRKLNRNKSIQLIFLYSIIGIFSLISTLINPFGFNLYKETFLHPASPAIKYISEWTPLSPNSAITWYITLGWGFLTIGGFVFSMFRKKGQETLPYFVMSMVLFSLSFFQARYVWSMYPISLIFISSIFDPVKIKDIRIKSILGMVCVFGFFIHVLFFILPGRGLDHISWQSYCEKINCSIAGANTLRNYRDLKIFTDYNFGGWLIWNYPEIKPSMDGRMSLWTDPMNNYSPFLDLYRPLEQGKLDPDTSKYDVFFIQNARPAADRLEMLSEAKKGWKLVFKDGSASVFVREKIKL